VTIPSAFAGVDARVKVGGQTAGEIDFFDLTHWYTPLAIALVLALSFLLLLVVFRSLVLPLLGVALNLLSVGAAYGLLVLVFQHGIGAGLFGFQQVETIQAWLPLFLFSVLFGLSMDYQVFLLSRIQERHSRTGDTRDAVAFGLRTTGGIITDAAVIMVAVFAGFAAGRLVELQQTGFGLAVAVLIHATLVRSVLVPAAMRLLGRRNWYLPSRLDGSRSSASRVPLRSQPLSRLSRSASDRRCRSTELCEGWGARSPCMAGRYREGLAGRPARPAGFTPRRPPRRGPAARPRTRRWRPARRRRRRRAAAPPGSPPG
jgi:uncharacterized membrane protein YdfJ with MMPL/SSD domain